MLYEISKIEKLYFYDKYLIFYKLEDFNILRIS